MMMICMRAACNRICLTTPWAIIVVATVCTGPFFIFVCSLLLSCQGELAGGPCSAAWNRARVKTAHTSNSSDVCSLIPTASVMYIETVKGRSGQWGVRLHVWSGIQDNHGRCQLITLERCQTKIPSTRLMVNNILIIIITPSSAPYSSDTRSEKQHATVRQGNGTWMSENTKGEGRNGGGVHGKREQEAAGERESEIRQSNMTIAVTPLQLLGTYDKVWQTDRAL